MDVKAIWTRILYKLIKADLVIKKDLGASVSSIDDKDGKKYVYLHV